MHSGPDPAFASWLAGDLPGLLPAFLPERRWFGGKDHAIANVTFEDAWWPDAADGRRAVAIVRVPRATDGSDRYVIVVAGVQDANDLPLIGEWSAGARRVVEAAMDPDVSRQVIRCLASPTAMPTLNGGRVMAADIDEPTRRAVLDATLATRALGSEQSNTSLRVGERWVFKLFRRLEPGENPELEVGRFLATRTDFRAMCGLRGSLSYVAADGTPSTLGVLQDWIDNRGDGWTYALGTLAECLRTGSPCAFAQDLHQLGGITAEFHAAMASGTGVPGFEPKAVSPVNLAGWQKQLTDRAARCAERLSRPDSSWPEDARNLADVVRGRLRQAGSLAAVAGDAVDTFLMIRIHGDYHLGQTLKTAESFALIDFEGEPSRPLADRRRRTCALRDVAGMLRSLEYAIETAAAGSTATADRLRNDLNLRESFLAGYFESPAASDATFLPHAGARERWLAFFELDKALYELEYEISHRPSWVGIPLRGILRALGS